MLALRPARLGGPFCFEGRLTPYVAHLIGGAAACIGAAPLVEHAQRAGYSLRPERITCPVRIGWGTAARLGFTAP